MVLSLVAEAEKLALILLMIDTDGQRGNGGRYRGGGQHSPLKTGLSVLELLRRIHRDSQAAFVGRYLAQRSIEATEGGPKGARAACRLISGFVSICQPTLKGQTTVAEQHRAA